MLDTGWNECRVAQAYPLNWSKQRYCKADSSSRSKRLIRLAICLSQQVFMAVTPVINCALQRGLLGQIGTALHDAHPGGLKISWYGFWLLVPAEGMEAAAAGASAACSALL